MRKPTVHTVHTTLALLALAWLGAPPGFGQSLTEAAQKEKERRNAAKTKPARTYGDQDLAGYAGERPPAPSAGAEEKAAPASEPGGAAKAAETAPPTAAESAEARERREKEERAAEAEDVRARWRESVRRFESAQERVARIEEEMKTLPPGLPAGNYREDILAAVEQQKADRERRYELAKRALAGAREAMDAVETEARRKSIRLD